MKSNFSFRYETIWVNEMKPAYYTQSFPTMVADKMIFTILQHFQTFSVPLQKRKYWGIVDCPNGSFIESIDAIKINGLECVCLEMGLFKHVC